MLYLFSDPDGTPSWRKIGTGLCFILYAFLVIGYAITHNFECVPSGYLGIFYLIFAFYFAKRALESKEFFSMLVSKGDKKAT